MRAIGTAATASLLTAGLLTVLVMEGCTSDDAGLMTDSRAERGGDAAAGASGTGGTTGTGGADGTGGTTGTGGVNGSGGTTGSGGVGGSGGLPGTGGAGSTDVCQPNARCGSVAETCQTACTNGYQFDCTCTAGVASRWTCRWQRCGDDAGVEAEGEPPPMCPASYPGSTCNDGDTVSDCCRAGVLRSCVCSNGAWSCPTNGEGGC